MQLKSITESGSNNILMWAISNGAVIRPDTQLISMINNSLFYHIRIDDINFFELFRLSQIYRDKIRVINNKFAEIPSSEELNEMFKGVYVPDKDKPNETINYSDMVAHCVKQFMDMAVQMDVDEDIIKKGASQLFLPMISRKYCIQIPFSFIDLINSMNDDEAAEIFNTDYPTTLDKIIENPTHGTNMFIRLGIIKQTSIIKYSHKLERYMNIIKYKPLSAIRDNNFLYKFACIAFFKYDNINKGEIRCEFFNLNKSEYENKLKKMKNINTPLKFKFAIELPIQIMYDLVSYFNADDLPVLYDSSMSSIISIGLNYNDFITYDTSDLPEDPENGNMPSYESVDEYIKFNNQIEAYKVRITEANQMTLNTIPILLDADSDINPTDVFSMLPSIYGTRAVITVDSSKKDLYMKHYNPMIVEMFNEMFKTINMLTSEIINTKK